MVTKIPAYRRHFADHGWLRTHYLFSFADYHDPNNVNFGTLRVFNDDVIDAHSGFGEHDHADMEIVTIVLSGELTHGDNMGNGGSIHEGEVQYMSAGSGVTHSEMNASSQPVHLYQIWILPAVESAVPRYAQKDFSTAAATDGLLAVASGQGKPGALEMRTDATIYKGSLAIGMKVAYPLPSGRGAFVYVTEGELSLGSETFGPGDQARVTSGDPLTIHAVEQARFILIDVPVLN